MKQFLPKIMKMLETGESEDTQRKVLVESLVLLNELLRLYPTLLLAPHISTVLKIAGKLKGHRKRMVRTVARATINEWSLAN